MVQRIVKEMPEERLLRDLERYRQMAADLGATDAEIITTDRVAADERVRAKCMYPRCRYFGTNANCPPHSMAPDETRRLADRFRYAVFFRVKVPIAVVADKRGPEEEKQLQLHLGMRNSIVARIESQAFYDGHYLAVGFGGGACKVTYCPKEECQALKGQSCRAPLRARASMESVGMDVFRMAADLGWDIYPIGKSPCDAPHASLTGIVFIG